MKINISIIKKAFGILFVLMALGCQDMDTPPLGDYPVDENPPGGPLKFYVPFDDNTTDPLKFAVDNIRAKFPSDNPFTQIDGISGKGAQGPADHTKKYIAYSKPNDFAATAKSFTISFWEKHNGPTKSAEIIFGLPSTNGHWTGGAMLLLFESPNVNATAVKFIIVDKNMADTWLTWEGANSIPGLVDNQWHHCVFVYDETTSGLTFYKDGVAISTKTWGTHGPVNLDDSKVGGFRLGSGPGPGPNDPWTGNSWLGGLDQFRMYSSALTTAEVTALYTGKE